MHTTRTQPQVHIAAPASGSSVTSRAYWLRSVGTKMKTIQIPPRKWSPQARNSEGRPPETTTTKILVSFPTAAVLVTSSSRRIKQKTESLPEFLPLHNPPPHPVGSPPKPLLKSDILF
ncbi:hypothetical protein E5288_WYG006090 [Bos mutus]|uniref:Uncharacterized protein n=1 Tax=Bos mutus TaxID=72004 RepID=A0A6B0SC20_9CETA|nr:hypothetical protein [Bos mutus]